MSDTPWTDERERVGKIRSSSALMGVVPAVYARELETELAEARAEIVRLDHQRRAGWTEIKRKNKLIDQLKLALKTLRKYPHTYKMTGQGCIVTDKDLEQCDAALLAAERGGE